MTTTKILAISGSLRGASLNTALLVAAQRACPPETTIELVSIADVPLYNGDIDVDGGPPPVRDLKERVAAADGLLIATPEYNHGIPGVLKNALDWLSRPAFESVLAHKPVAIVSVASSPVGGARAQGQLKQVMLGVLGDVFPWPELVVGRAKEQFDSAGRLVDERTQKRLVKLLTAYGPWIAKRAG